MEKLTRQQAAIIGIFTGITCGPFEDIQELGDELMGYPTFTRQYGDKEFVEKLKELCKPRFIEICATKDKP